MSLKNPKCTRTDVFVLLNRMPHKRNGHGHGHVQAAVEGQGLQIDPEKIENHDPNLTRCSVPTECFKENSPIRLDNLLNVVKVVCNNDHCNQGQYMHRECFESWQQTVLTYLRSCGRARSWSEKQRLQNLWTKKGYDLAFKACGCKCGRGHLRKDLDWIPPKAGHLQDNEGGKKKKKKNRQNVKPILAINTPQHQHHPNAQHTQRTNSVSETEVVGPLGGGPGMALTLAQRNRANSVSSSGSLVSSSPPSSGSESPNSPSHGSGGTKKKTKFDFFSDRSRHGSGGSGIFSRRMDFSSFNALPKHKINSYHIKMEDEGNHGNDDTRCFILSNLAVSRTARTACVLCHNTMHIFDRYPLVDGAFFLSPRQHSKSCIQVKVDGRSQYLCAVCMGCLEGWNLTLSCRYCQTRWNGASLILGTMYSFDIFAAIPCCAERLKCNSCHKMVIYPEQLFGFFSDYSHSVSCPHCGVIDFHFVKSLTTYNKNESCSQWS